MREPAPELFRREAIEHHLREEEAQGVVRVAPPWTWALLGGVLCGLATALAVACAVRVEVKGRARGILRPVTGVRVVLARVEGTVGRVEARSGQEVRAGQALVRLEAPQVQAGLLEAERQLEAVRKTFPATIRGQDRAFREQARRIGLREVRLREQIQAQRQSLVLAERNLGRNAALEAAGVLSAASVDRAREALAQARSGLSQSEHGLEQASQDQAALDLARQEVLWQRRLTIRNAEVRVESLALLQARTLHAAPEDGRVEALLVRVGEEVRAGQALCKVLPRDAPLQAVAFLAERDRAFVRPGDDVVLELDQLPYAEYGTCRGRVARISDDLASDFEVREALGDAPPDPGPSFRVELDLTDTHALARAGIPPRSGMLLQARFTLRRQRFITLLLDPLRKGLR